MQRELAETPNLHILQGDVEDILLDENDKVQLLLLLQLQLYKYSHYHFLLHVPCTCSASSFR
jgi:tRNA U34 5-carboxymethylaminomethyl modifying enzyme MnmG/GidA